MLNNDLTAKTDFYFANATKHITNPLQVDLESSFHELNSCGYCTVNDNNAPDGFQSGMREVFRRDKNHVMVRLTGIATDNTPGMWVNYFLYDRWLGWKRFN